MKIESGFYTAIIIGIGTFASEIIEEKHFPSEDEAREYCQTLEEGQIAVIAKL